MKNNGLITKSVFFGFVGSALLLIVYFLIMILAKNTFSSALDQLNNLKLWIVPLITLFGIQVGLFVYARDCRKHVSSKATTMSAGTSGVAMLACCAHHVTDILPIIGLSVAATFLSKYQTWFLGVGILSNILGILLMIREIKKMKTL